ncbi:MAG TPA: hypothetical protein VGO80_15270 [Solirubrobacteraceae bacterium]|jgi:hypothetical protein|nr:hypothetical protein [Solirubrobacteraceae bacterium]
MPLFGDDTGTVPPDATILGGLLRAECATRVFTIRDAEDFTLCRTKYLDSPHLGWGGRRPKSGGRALEGREWNGMPNRATAGRC